MKDSFRTGVSFGMTSGIITTLGLIVGLNASTHSLMVVIGGIIVIAVADALSDSMGIHVSEEAENKHTVREIWEAMGATFIIKFLVAMSFIVPILFLGLANGVIVDIIWALSLTVVFSVHMAREQKHSCTRAVVEHLALTVAVVIITFLIGNWVATLG
ncbi:MAG: hypothetical protein V1870_03305 [Candidatus Aenigmatarchaeota archaeon]